MTISSEAPREAAVSVPPVGARRAVWRSQPRVGQSRRRQLQERGAFSYAIPQPIADLVVRLPQGVAADAAEAEAALRAFDAGTRAAFGGEEVLLGPMSSVLLRTESTSSSQIERLTVGARQLALAQVGASRSVNAVTVAANVRAMQAALALADDLSAEAVLHMHGALLAEDPSMKDEAGRFRGQPVWVGGSAFSPVNAVHVAPPAELVAPAVDDCLAFLARADVPVVAQVAIAHAQFETIHPFADGNGRTGRALVQAALRAKAVTSSVTAPVSGGLLHVQQTYFEALTAFRWGDAGPIVDAFVQACLYAGTRGARLVADLRDRVAELRGRVSGVNRGALVHRLVPLLVEQPAVTSRFVAERMGVPVTSAVRALDRLTDAGVLTVASQGRRNRIWVQPDIIRTLDEFAASLRRG